MVNDITQPLKPLQHLGSPWLAQHIAKRAYHNIPAYRQFLHDRHLKLPLAFQDLPPTDKSSYLIPNTFSNLTGGNLDRSFMLYRSSGSSGQPQYWPMLRSSNRGSHLASKWFLEQTFQIHRKKTLIIVASSLGSWLGGTHFATTFQILAEKSHYPITLFTPGANHLEILHTIQDLHSHFQQILILISPSFIPLIYHQAEALRITLPLEKINYLVTAEYFPESLRLSLAERANFSPSSRFMLSMYASTDTLGLGTESFASIALRQLLFKYPELAESLKIPHPLPLFFHYLAFNAFLETNQDQFLVTRWQGIPLVRYQLRDRVTLYPWPQLKQALLSSKIIPQDDPLYTRLATSSNFLPNILAVSGRSDKTLILGGSNFTEAMFDHVIKSEDLSPLLTGCYQAEIVNLETGAQLSLVLEVKSTLNLDTDQKQIIHGIILQKLGEVQPEFKQDYQEIYQPLEQQIASYSPLKLNFLAYPELSQHHQTKVKQSNLLL